MGEINLGYRDRMSSIIDKYLKFKRYRATSQKNRNIIRSTRLSWDHKVPKGERPTRTVSLFDFYKYTVKYVSVILSV